jgi:orotate phosphoribosyltransferase
MKSFVRGCSQPVSHKHLRYLSEDSGDSTMVNLIPSQATVLELLRKTGALRLGHFRFPSGKCSAHYFQMPLAFRYYDSARVLAVALSRKFRVNRDISSQLPKIAIISPSPGGIPVAFGVREALCAEQIYWAEREDGKRMFRQYVTQGEINPCIIVDDIIRSGKAMAETVKLVQDLGVEIIGAGAIVRFNGAPDSIGEVQIQSLADFDSGFYDSWEACCAANKNANPQAPEELVRF